MSKILIRKLEILLSTGELLEIVDSQLSATGVLDILGYTKKGQYISIVREWLISNDIDISHWTGNGKPKLLKIEKICPVCKLLFRTEPRVEKEQITCSRSCSNTYFRSGEDHPSYNGGTNTYRERALSYYRPLCNRCGYTNILAIEVHHRDKDRSNNSIENLEVLCANCHTIEHKSSK